MFSKKNFIVFSVLIQCAEHTITEDCLMGLSYLLNLDENYFMDVIDLFENLPQSELYHQVLAYFCSIKLYTKLNAESHNVFQYDPLELIQHMSSVKISENDTDNKKLKQRMNMLIQVIKQKPSERFELDVRVDNAEPVSEVENHSSNSKIEKPLEFVQTPEVVDEWNTWGDDWNDTHELTKVEEKQNLSLSNNSLGITGKDFVTDSDNWGDEWTDMPVNIKREGEKQLFSLNETLNIIEKDVDTDGWDDEWTDMPVNTKREDEQQLSTVHDRLGVDEKNVEGDAWGDEWTDMPGSKIQTDLGVNTKFEEDQQVSGMNDSLGGSEKNVENDGWGDEWTALPGSTNTTDVPVNTKREEEQQEFGVSNNLEGIEKNVEADGWGDEWTDMPSNTSGTDMPVKTKSEGEQQLSDVHDHLDVMEKNVEADGWGDEWTDMPGSSKSADVEETTNLKEASHFEEHEADGWDNEWTDIPSTIVTDESNEMVDSSKLLNITESSTSPEKRYEVLANEIEKIQNIDDCLNVKKALLHKPCINNADTSSDSNSNLFIQLIKKMIEINKTNNSIDDGMLQGIKNFLQEGIISQKVRCILIQNYQ